MIHTMSGGDTSGYAQRRQRLCDLIKAAHPGTSGSILLTGNFEYDSMRSVFHQESSFYYFTGIQEPGIALLIDCETNKATLYVPDCGTRRGQWVHQEIPLVPEAAARLGVDAVTMLGDECPGYTLAPVFEKEQCRHLCDQLADSVAQDQSLFTLAPESTWDYVEQRRVLARYASFVPGLERAVIDVSDLVAQLRRIKDQTEIEKHYRAIGATCLAHEAAARAISDGVSEAEVQAHLEFIMTGSSMPPAYPSIVASGKNSTILHYTRNDRIMHNGDLILIDVGASCDGYCADITRTYPVSGTFAVRQKEIYNLVLATQEHVASMAKPGMYLRNPDHPEKSLNHIALTYLAEHGGYDKYMPHGIGHYLGLDVHDVGSYKEPLQPGDVITIEPGVYLPDEKLGVRIEDNYWIVEDGAVCLSDEIPKTTEAIESLVSESIAEDDADDFDESAGGVAH